MVCSFSRFCILHWWSFPRPHHRKVLRKKNTNISSSQIQSSKKDWKKPYRFLSVIQTCQNNVKVIFPRGQADNYGKQNGVRIPRQILISRGYSGPITHHFGDNRILVVKHDRGFSFHMWGWTPHEVWTAYCSLPFYSTEFKFHVWNQVELVSSCGRATVEPA